MQEKQQRYVLASQSPRRREMAAWLALPFETVATDVDETPLPGEAPWALAVRLAREKACAGNGLGHGSLVLAADTVVELEGVSLGKPANAAEAFSMLVALKGKDHAVHTAVALWNGDTGASALRCVSTVVTMREYSEPEIAAYIATGDPFDKAGGYAIQHAGFHPVARLERCYANVVGLPLCAVLHLLGPAAGSELRHDALDLCRERFGYACPRPDWGEVTPIDQ